MITLAETAIKAVDRFRKDAENPAAGLRIQGTGGGCSSCHEAIEEGLTRPRAHRLLGEIRAFVARHKRTPRRGARHRFHQALQETQKHAF